LFASCCGVLARNCADSSANSVLLFELTPNGCLSATTDVMFSDRFL
jgi:hypothetical protein